MRVLSLFDGISCARVALQKAGVEVETYYAAEVEKSAIKVALKNFPDTIQVGDVRELTGSSLGHIDLLIGGSPCQDLSIAKKGRKGLDGDRSSLFWEYVRLLREVKPKWFVLENVASMPQKDKDIITAEMGVEPVLFNAALVSAQSRKRLFWTNIKFELPVDRNILLKDILQADGEVDDRMVTHGKAFCVLASYARTSSSEKGVERSSKSKVGTMVKVGYVGEGEQHGQGGQAHRVYSPDGKTPTLGSGSPLVKLGHVGEHDHQAKLVYDADGKCPALNVVCNSMVRIGTEVGRRLKNGVRADGDKTAPMVRRIELRNDDKCGTLTTVQKDNQVVNTETHRIRKLTPIECERLQCLPDNYTEGIAMTNRYKCLGNGFNVDVVAHILSGVTEGLPPVSAVASQP